MQGVIFEGGGNELLKAGQLDGFSEAGPRTVTAGPAGKRVGDGRRVGCFLPEQFQGTCLCGAAYPIVAFLRAALFIVHQGYLSGHVHGLFTFIFSGLFFEGSQLLRQGVHQVGKVGPQYSPEAVLAKYLERSFSGFLLPHFGHLISLSTAVNPQ